MVSNLSCKYCCDANIVAIKCVHFESVHFNQQPAIKYSQCLVTKVTEYLCSGCFFFFRLISIFSLAIFDAIFKLGYKNCHFGQFGTINERYILRFQRISGDLSRLRNLSKLIEGSLFAVIDLLLGAKFLNLYFIWRVGDDFDKKAQFKKILSVLLHLIFSCYYCSIDCSLN